MLLLIGLSGGILAACGGGGGGGQGGQGQGQDGGDQDQTIEQEGGSDMTGVVPEHLQSPEDKNIIQFKSLIGTVTFLHQMHAGLKITQCNTCHHKMEPTDTVVKSCHECHKKKSVEPPKAMKVCHEYTVAGGQKAGPLPKKCKLCHIKTKKKK